VQAVPTLKTAMAVSALVPPAVAVALYLSSQKTSFFWPRYQLFLTIPMFLLVAAGINSFKFRSRAPFYLLAIVPLGIGMGEGLRAYTNFYRGDWDRAAAAIARSATNEPVLVYPANLSDALARYMTGQNRIFPLSRADLTQQAGISRIFENTEGVWLALAWSAGQPLAVQVQEELKRYFRKEESFPLRSGRDGLKLLHYFSPRSGALPTKGSSQAGH
jgi:hypothetical protein